MKEKDEFAGKKLQWIDALRGVVCLIVCFAHIFASDSNLAIYMSGCGKIGVWCFMVMTGYFALKPYANRTNISKELALKQSIHYYKKKILRIFPSYIVILILSYMLGWLNSKGDVLKHVVALEGNGHFWYMPVIIKFYIIFPIFMILFMYISKTNFFIVMLVCIGSMIGILFPYYKYPENSISLMWYLPVFIIGMLLVFIMKNTDSDSGYKKNTIFYDFITVVFLTLIISMTPYFREKVFGIEPSSWLQNKYLYLGIIWAGVLWSINSGILFRNFLQKSTALVFTGKISYEIYLIHYVVLWVYGVKIENIIGRLCFTLVVTFIISLIAHWASSKIASSIKKYVLCK